MNQCVRWNIRKKIVMHEFTIQEGAKGEKAEQQASVLQVQGYQQQHQLQLTPQQHT